MAICDFKGVFSVFLKYTTGVGKDSLYSCIFKSYYDLSDDPSIVLEFTGSKVAAGKRFMSQDGKRFYCKAENYITLRNDLDGNVLPFISDKFAMCNEIRQLIISDGMYEDDKQNLLSLLSCFRRRNFRFYRQCDIIFT